MKTQLKITILVTIYLICLAGIYWGSSWYVEKKDRRLRSEAYQKLTDFFNYQKIFINVAYSDKDVAYERTSIPKFDPSGYHFNINEDKIIWKRNYGDLYKMYKLKPKYTSEIDILSDRQWTGWLYNVIEKTSSGFCEYQIYPIKVGYIKQDNTWLYNYAPSVQTAINESYDFHTNNEKSSYSKYICRDKTISWIDVNDAIENEYYNLFSYDDLIESYGKYKTDSILQSFSWNENHSSSYTFVGNDRTIDYSYMYNGYYKVYNERYTSKYWDVFYKFREDPETKDRNNILIWFISIFTIAFISLLIFLLRKKNKEEILINENLKERLTRECNPQNFFKPYDKERIDKANLIYNQVLNVDVSDETELKRLRKIASVDLEINFIDKQKRDNLTKLCNPENFLAPYNAEKVMLSNELYSKLTSQSLDIDELEEIEKKMNELYDRF